MKQIRLMYACEFPGHVMAPLKHRDDPDVSYALVLFDTVTGDVSEVELLFTDEIAETRRTHLGIE